MVIPFRGESLPGAHPSCRRFRWFPQPFWRRIYRLQSSHLRKLRKLLHFPPRAKRKQRRATSRFSRFMATGFPMRKNLTFDAFAFWRKCPSTMFESTLSITATLLRCISSRSSSARRSLLRLPCVVRAPTRQKNPERPLYAFGRNLLSAIIGTLQEDRDEAAIAGGINTDLSGPEHEARSSLERLRAADTRDRPATGEGC